MNFLRRAIFFPTFVFCVLLSSCSEIEVENDSIAANTTSTTFKTANDFFDFPKPKILVVGVFHFEYPNLDALKTEDKDKIDVLSEQRQKDMRELVDYIKKFKPNKIGVEAFPRKDYTKDLEAYKKGELTLDRSEHHQLGVRIASELNLDSVHSVDAGSMFNDIRNRNEEYADEIWKDYDWKHDSKTDIIKREWFAYKNEILKEMSLLDYLKYMNTRESHEVGYGTYLTDDFTLGKYQGADALSSYWYNRNLRILRNIQEITAGPEDRILVIFGNGHAALFRQFFEYSVEYDYVEFTSLDE